MTKASDLARHIPSALLDIDCWNTWSMARTASGKQTKRPDGSILDPANRHSFSNLSDTSVDKSRGVGFVFTEGIFIKGYRLLSFDIDACREPKTGTISKWARVVLDEYDSFTEITPSGTGLRLWLLVKKPPQSLPIINVPHPAPKGIDKNTEIQTFGFGSAQYVCVTGNQLKGSSSKILKVKDVEWFIDHFNVRGIEMNGVTTELPTGKGEAPTLKEIDATVKRDPQGAKLAKGDWKGNGIESASEAYWRLQQIVGRAARDHGDAAVNYLLEKTAFGEGLVDSKDPDRYTRRSWVERDFARTSGKTIDSSGKSFDDGFDAHAWKPPTSSKNIVKNRVLQAADFDAECGVTEMLFYGLLPASGLAQIFGESSCGKTPFALSLALHVVLGKDWFGYELDRPGSAVYMIGEDMSGVRDRVRGQLSSLDPEISLSDIPFYLTTEPGHLIDHEDANRWVKDIRKVIGGESVSLLVVDTQNRNFGPGNENSTEDMTKFVDGIDIIRRKLKCCILLIHHVGLVDKDRARGSSVLFGALDAQYEVLKIGMSVTMNPHKGKNWELPKPVEGVLKVEPIGVDRKGRPVTAITLTDRKDPSVFDKSLMQDPHFQLILDFIRIKEGKGITISQMAKACSTTPKSVRIRLEAAESSGLIEKTSGAGGKANTYRVTDLGINCFYPDEEEDDIEELLS